MTKTTRICTLAVLPAFLGLVAVAAPVAAASTQDARSSLTAVPAAIPRVVEAPPYVYDPMPSLEVLASEPVATGAGPSPANCGFTERVSVASDGTEHNGSSGTWAIGISEHGRVAAFISSASNLVPGDTNGVQDAFVHDRETGTTERVSVASDGTEADGGSFLGAISADGRYVAFYSAASNLVPGVTGFQVYVHDRDTGVTEVVSVASDGAPGDGASLQPALSANGRFVAFESDANNLVPDDTNGRDVFVHDRDTGTTERVSVASDGSEGTGDGIYTGWTSINADGRFVSFHSDYTNLVPDDINDVEDVFVHDRETGITERVSVASDGTEANDLSDTRGGQGISDDGRFVVFGSLATNLVPDDTNGFLDTFVHDRETGATERISIAFDGTEGDSGSGENAISGDGRFVAFQSAACNLVPEDTTCGLGGRDVFVRDRQTEDIRRAHVASDCTEANSHVVPISSSVVRISADGRHVAFGSLASNLIPDDTNETEDVFVNTAPELAIVPDPMDFGPVLVSQTRGPLSVSVTNASLADVTVTEISEPEAPFTAEGGTCDPVPFTLAPEESCELAFGFSPTAAGDFEDVLELTSDALNAPHFIALRGMGSEVQLHIAPDPLDFGEALTVETSRPSSVTLANADATVPVEVSAVSAPTEPFAAASGTCGEPPFSLDPFASCTFTYTFSPTASGSFSDVVEVTSDAPNNPASFALEGEGLLVELTIDPDPLDFGAVPVDETAGPLSVTVTNTGDVDAYLVAVPTPSTPFTVAGDTCGNISLPIGESCTLSYTFHPLIAGEASATVPISIQVSRGPFVFNLSDFTTFSLHGTGSGAILEIDPASLEATLDPGQTETQPLTLANVGNETLEWEVTEDSGAQGRTDASGQILWPIATATVPESAPPPAAVEGFTRASNVEEAETVPFAFPSVVEETTITHSQSLDIQSPNSVTCGSGGTTVENHYLRTFTLTDFNIFSDFDVSEVTFGIETLSATAPITVNLYTLEGEFTFDNLTLIGTATENLGPQDLTLVTVPVTGSAPAGSILVIEIEAPDLAGVAAFFPGSNNLGETAPSYIAASDCGIDEPTPYAEVGDGFPDVHLVMTVTGEAEPLDCSLPSWVGVDPTSGSIPAEGSEEINVTFDATGLIPGDYETFLCLDSNDPLRPLRVVPSTLTVSGVGGPALAFDPTGLDFGEVEVGDTSLPQPAMLHNIGNVDLTGLTSSGLPAAGFEADTSACGDALPVGGSCEISLTFTPEVPGPVDATLLAESAEGAAAELSLAGNGVGAGFTPMALAVDPAERVSDGNGVFEPGELVDVAPTWRNDGTDPVSLTGTASDFVGPGGADYTLSDADADYGLVDPSAEASCQDTGVCYRVGVDDPAARPATHWEATFDETLSDDTTTTWSLHIGDSFSDVPRTSPFYASIETLLHHGVTEGCTATAYCPAGSNTRAQMAVFLLKAAEGADYTPPACEAGEGEFPDVPTDSMFCPWIEELAARGVTSGCGGGNYCPADSVTRAQMAVFLLKAAEGEGYTPPECTNMFTDVPCPSTFANWIEDLAQRGITSGCSATTYCPGETVTRAQMAVFLSKAFGLVLYGP